MDVQADKRDLQLLEGDKYTFAVLSRILNGPCRLIATDHERLIICHSAAPYPVWVWTPDDMAVEEKERAWAAVMQACPMKDGYRYNVKYELAEFFLQKAREQGMDAEIMINMFAYDCPEPIAPGEAADGNLHLCAEDDMEEAVKMLRLFHEETAVDQDDEGYRRTAKELIGDRRFFFWKDSFGRTVACCYYVPNGDSASVSGVYTFPAHRRKHYAENMVYQVTKRIKDAGAMPMLYTDADYAASNACYEKIGYVLKGKLCTVGAKAVACGTMTA